MLRDRLAKNVRGTREAAGLTQDDVGRRGGVQPAVIGLAGMSQAEHRIVEVHVGDAIDMAGYRWTLDSIRSAPGPNYTSRAATITVTRRGRVVTVLHPSKRNFPQQSQTTSEVAIHTNLLSDLYAVLGDEHSSKAGGNTVVLRLHDNPLAPWMWLGALVMAIGGGLSLSDRRVRVGAPRRAEAAAAGKEPGGAVVQSVG